MARASGMPAARVAGFFQVQFSVAARQGRRIERRIVYAASRSEALRSLPDGAVVHRVRWRPRTMLDRQFILSAERIGFLRAFGAFINAGQSPARALRQTIDISFAMQPAKRTQMQPAIDALEDGQDFITAARLTGVFDAPILGLLAAGAQTRIREVIGALHDYLETRQKLYAMAVSQLALVVFEFIGAMLTVLWLEASGFDLFVSLADQAQSATVAAKADYLSAIALCRLVNRLLLLVLTAGSGLLAFLYVGLRSSGTWLEEAAGQLLMRVPLLRVVAADLGLAETAGIFGRLLAGEIPWQRALEVVIGSAPVGPVRAYWNEVRRLNERTALSGAEILVQARGLLHPWEGYPLLAHRDSTRDLGGALMQLARDRQEAAHRSTRGTVRSVSAAMIALMTAVMVMVFYLGLVQSQLSMADMSGTLDNGGFSGSGATGGGP